MAGEPAPGGAAMAAAEIARLLHGFIAEPIANQVAGEIEEIIWRYFPAPPESAMRQRLQEMVDAIEGKHIDIDSGIIDSGDPECEGWAWHEEWLHHAKAALSAAPAEEGGDADVIFDGVNMGSPLAAAEKLAELARRWREMRQPSIATAAEHKKQHALEHEVRFQLANAALMWLWHRENPASRPGGRR